MYCQNCGNIVDEKWSYCPNCGVSIYPKEGGLLKPSFVDFPDFGSLINEIVKGIDEMTNQLGKKYTEKDFEKIRHDFKDLFDLPLGVGGVSVKISSSNDKEPKMDIKTFGNLRGHEDALKRWFGIPSIEENVAEELQEELLKDRKPPKVTEEPKTIVNRIGNKLEFRISVPGVKSEADINVRQIQDSIEVRGYVDDKAYFTLFSTPPGSKIRSKRLEDEVIIIEVEG